MSSWGDLIEVPELGPGWKKMTKARLSEQGTYHVWVSPAGKRFRSEKQAKEYIRLGGGSNNTALAATTATEPATKGQDTAKKKSKVSKPVSRSAKVPYNPPAALAAASAAAAAAVPDIVCKVCGKGVEPQGNSILLCDGFGCNGAYHMKCLPEPLEVVPKWDWLCPTCEKPPPPAELVQPLPHCKGRGVRRELQRVADVDVGEWAVLEAQRLRQAAKVAPVKLSSLAGCSCLAILPPRQGSSTRSAAPASTSAPRAGMVIDAQLAQPGGELTLCVALKGRSTPTWLSTADSSGATIFLGAEICFHARIGQSLWPARVFRRVTLASLKTDGDESSRYAFQRGRGLGRGRARGSRGGKQCKTAGTTPEPVWVKFFGAPSAPLTYTTTDQLVPFTLALERPPLEDEPALQATFDAVNWAVRHPDHDRWSEPLSTPPSDVMESLVGRAVELLRPGENAWHKALVQDYSPHSGKHCVLFADGETEWLALPRGFYAWQLSSDRPYKLLSSEQESHLRDQLEACVWQVRKKSAPGIPIGITPDDCRLYGPPVTCHNCEAPRTSPGELFSCWYCTQTYHQRCIDVPCEGDLLLCETCAQCEACGAIGANEAVGCLELRDTPSLGRGWQLDAGRRILCVSCAAGLRVGARCATTLQQWREGDTALYCSNCSMWSRADRREDAEAVGAPKPVPMPPPIPARTSKVMAEATTSSCSRCERMAMWLTMCDALDELEALDPLGYFAQPVDEEAIPEYRSVIPDPMDFNTMRRKLNRGEYTEPRQLAGDFALICRNALVFNTKSDNPFRIAATQLHKRGQAVLRAAFGPSEAGASDSDAQLNNDDLSGQPLDGVAAIDEDIATDSQPANSSPALWRHQGDCEVASSGSPHGSDKHLPSELEAQEEGQADADVVSRRKQASSKDVKVKFELASKEEGGEREEYDFHATCESRGAPKELFYTLLPAVEGASLSPTDDVENGGFDDLKCGDCTDGMAKRSRVGKASWDALGMLPAACAKCGSSGEGKYRLLMCICCGESYHRFCLGMREDADLDPRTWKCSDCTFCSQCRAGHDDANLLLCDCGEAYHTYCLDPPMKQVPSGDWRCPKCISLIKCERCGTSKPGRSGWRMGYRFCDKCYKMHLDKKYCPVCMEHVREHEMVCCGSCEFWVHNECDGITAGGYDCMQDENFKYYCPTCGKREPKVFGAELEQQLVKKSPKSTVPPEAQNGGPSIPTVTLSTLAPPQHTLEAPWLSSELGKGYTPSPVVRETTRPWGGSGIKKVKRKKPKEESTSQQRHELLLAATEHEFAAEKAREQHAVDLKLEPVPVKRRQQQALEPKRQWPQSPEPVSSMYMPPAAVLAIQHGAMSQVQAPAYNEGGFVDRRAPSRGSNPMHSWQAQHQVTQWPQSLQSGSSAQYDYQQLPPARPMHPDMHVANGHPSFPPFELEPRAGIMLLPQQYPRQVHAQTQKTVPFAPMHSARSHPAVVSPTESSQGQFHPMYHYPQASSMPPSYPPSPSDFAIDQEMLEGSLNKNDEDCMAVTPGTPAHGHHGYRDAQQRPTSFPRHVPCRFCHRTADNDVCDRMLFVEQGTWVHLNCLSWSSESLETIAGELTKAHATLQRSRKLQCAHCGEMGASIGCHVFRCKRSFHYPCLSPSGALMLADKRVYCEEHRGVKAALRGIIIAEDAPVDRPVSVLRKRTPVGDLPMPSGQWLRVGALTVINPGRSPARPGDPPVGYIAWRRHWSTVHEHQTCGYELSICAQHDSFVQGTLTFRIICEHQPLQPIESSSALGAVQQLYTRLRAVSELPQRQRVEYPYSAAYFFGWVTEPVQRVLHGSEEERQQGAEERVKHVNPSGCARSEPVNWRRAVVATAESAELAARQAEQRARRGKRSRATADDEVDMRSRDLLPPGNFEMLKNLNDTARARFKVKRSNIHGWGLFVKTPIAKGEMLIEYQGWVVRQSIADRLMERYTRAGVPGATDGSYIFRIDDNTQVDATMAGNMARFMNHSCAPNAYSKVVEISKGALGKRIVVFALRDLEVGEELQYDYKFALGGDKITCHCGAPNCWGRMN